MIGHVVGVPMSIAGEALAMGQELVHGAQVLVVGELSASTGPLHLALPAGVQLAALVGPITQAELAARGHQPIGHHAEDRLRHRHPRTARQGFHQLHQPDRHQPDH